LSSGRCYLSTQSQTWYHSASSGPSAGVSSSGFNNTNEEANAHENDDVKAGLADAQAL